MPDCIFCRIAAGEIPADKVYEDDRCLVFRDLDPQAPVHLLMIPKEHLAGADTVTPGDAALVGHLFSVIPGVMEQLGVTQGFRVVTNVGAHGGQSVRHLHFHLLAGRELAWPPG